MSRSVHSARDRRISFDYIALFWYVLAVSLTFYIGLVSQDLNVKVTTLIGLTMGTVGLVSASFLNYVKLDLKRKISTINWLIATLAGTGLVLFVNLAINLGGHVMKFAVTWDIAVAFVVSMAVFEEEFFRLFLLPLFTTTVRILPRKYGGELIGIMIAAGAGAIFHFGVYALNTEALLIVFGAWIVLNYITLVNRRISDTMTSHGAINFLSQVTFALVKI